MPSNPAEARAFRRHRALRISNQARAAERHHRPVRAALVTATHAVEYDVAKSDLLLCRPPIFGEFHGWQSMASPLWSSASLFGAPPANAPEPAGGRYRHLADPGRRRQGARQQMRRRKSAASWSGCKDPIDPATGKPAGRRQESQSGAGQTPDDRPAAVQRHAARRSRQMVRPDLQRRRRQHLCQQRLGAGPGHA